MKTENKIPKIPDSISNGWISQQRVRCGKPNCRCSRGKPHTGNYFFTRVGGKLTKLYIRKADLEAFRKVVDAAARHRRFQQQRRKENKQQLQSFIRQLRETDTFLKSHRKTMDKNIWLPN